MKSRTSFIPEATKNFLVNAGYFIVVFAIALAVSTMALTRRVNSYISTHSPLLFTIQKQEIVITNATSGVLQKVYVVSGQHVKKGDLLAELSDQVSQQKLLALEKNSGQNVSAQTEAQVLKASISQSQIKAPHDGVVYQINALEGSYVNQASLLMTMFADDDVKIMGLVTNDGYDRLQRKKTFDVYSPRFGQTFTIVFEGAGKITEDKDTNEMKYEVLFHFTDPTEGAAFIQGEGVEVVSESTSEDHFSPSGTVAKFWNSFIIGK